MFIIFVTNICSFKMPRPKRIRRVTNPPHFKGFRPMAIPDGGAPIVVNFEEYEAIKLSDYDLHGQVAAASIMGVSRPTFARIYESARRKIAQAFIEGRSIVFEGGKFYLDSSWYACNNCGCWFNHSDTNENTINCTLCGSSEVEPYAKEDDIQDIEFCQCPSCGKESQSIPRAGCKDDICPECNVRMIRKNKTSHHRMRNQKCRKH
jgi:predicted DNA-binding protein (UPF0251 family)/DNA-directed RNA polymerase subunit RPC12/RpoP